MKTELELKNIVQLKYAEIANQSKDENASSCCGAGGCSTKVYNIMTDDYTKVEGYNADADLGLGCGLPTEFAQIKEGDIVISSGLGDNIPRGLVIGRVAQVNNQSNEIWQDVSIEPIASLYNLTVVAVVLP